MPWNVFDAVMVSVGYTQFLPTGGAGADSFRALRAIRALRPLRTITRFDSLRAVVVCFMEAIPLLMSVAAMLLFFLFLFAVAGVQMFGSVYHWACVDVSLPAPLLRRALSHTAMGHSRSRAAGGYAERPIRPSWPRLPHLNPQSLCLTTAHPEIFLSVPAGHIPCSCPTNFLAPKRCIPPSHHATPHLCL